MNDTENLGRELARMVHQLSALQDERKAAVQDFKLREENIRREINRLALDIRTGQRSMFATQEDGR